MTTGWLAQLAPAHPPPPPGWWPPAPGWWALAALFAAVVAWGVRAWLAPWRRRRRRALAELRRIRAADPADVAGIARQIESLLRRYAVAHYGAATVARLSGSAWLQFVAARGGGALAGAAGPALLSAAFGGAAPDERAQWFAAANGFLRHPGRVS